MSMTKNCAAFDRMMEEQRMADERSFEEYQEEQYFRTFRKDRFPPDHEQVTPPKGTTQTTQ
jgi:hypothetical protein